MGVDPVTAIAEAIKEIAATIRLAFNGKNREILSDIKRINRMEKALNVAEESFYIVDEIITLVKVTDDFDEDHKLRKKYDKLKDKFNKLD